MASSLSAQIRIFGFETLQMEELWKQWFEFMTFGVRVVQWSGQEEDTSHHLNSNDERLLFHLSDF